MNRRYGTTRVQILPIKHNGEHVRQVQFRRRNNPYTRQEVADMGNELRTILNNRPENVSGSLQIEVYVPNLGWRSTKMVDIEHGNPTVFSFDDYDSTQKYPDNRYDDSEFTSVNMYFYRNPPREGRGQSEIQSDCFFTCMRKVLQKNEFPFDSDEALKRYFCLRKRDGITVEHVAKIEKMMTKTDYGINVYGDYTYTSSKKTNYYIDLYLHDGHYTLKTKAPKVLRQGGGTPMFYRVRRTSEGMKSFYCFIDPDSDKFVSGNMSMEEWKQRENEKTPFTYFSGLELNETQARDMINMMDTLWKETNGKINMFKTASYVTTAQKLFYDFNLGLCNTEHIDQHEAHWIDEASIGGMLWCEKGFEGKVYKYDFVSHYPSILSSEKFRFPIKRGEFQKITNLDKITYGIYRVKINNVNKKLFRTNPAHYYTHVDLFWAKKLGASLELIQDDAPNFLSYSPDKLMPCSRVFGRYVKFLFELKKQKVPGAKPLLNVLWGALCQKNLIKHFVHNDNVPEYKGKIYDITSLSNPEDENEGSSFQFRTIDTDVQYKTNYARIAPFLLARGRAILGETLLPNIDHIVRVHTDGFASTKKLQVETGTELNCLKYEGKQHCRIQNVNKIVTQE
jgi:hypothetical protein